MTLDERTTSKLNLPDVAETALATLWSRGLESLSSNPILADPKAVELMALLRPTLVKSGTSALADSLARDEIDSTMQTYVALRSKRMDLCAKEHLAKHPHGMVVNLGCGLDTRRWRINSERVIDIDLPEMVRLRRSLLGDHAVAADVSDHSWFTKVRRIGNGPVLFLAEGLFMYLPKPVLEHLIGRMAIEFPGSGLAAEVFGSFWLMPKRRGHIRTRLSDTLHFAQGVDFVSGLDTPDEMEGWGDEIRFIDDWSFLDEAEPKLGRLRKLKHFPRFRARQTIVRYRLG